MGKHPHTNIVLIGYRGTGKTAVAQRLAELLGCDWADTDDEIEQRAGKSIADLFQSVGEAGFRDLESQCVEELTERDDLVLAAGGGAVLRESNRQLLKAFGHTVLLTATPETICHRLAGDPQTADRRPKLTNAGGLTEVEDLLAQRTPIYRQCADLTVDTECRTPSEVAEEIIDQLGLSPKGVERPDQPDE